MGLKETLISEHQKLKDFDFSYESVEFLKAHIEREEQFFRENIQKLGGEDELSPLGMVLSEHKLLLKFLEEGKKEQFLELLKYHLVKEESQIYPLLD